MISNLIDASHIHTLLDTTLEDITRLSSSSRASFPFEKHIHTSKWWDGLYPSIYTCAKVVERYRVAIGDEVKYERALSQHQNRPRGVGERFSMGIIHISVHFSDKDQRGRHTFYTCCRIGLRSSFFWIEIVRLANSTSSSIIFPKFRNSEVPCRVLWTREREVERNI